MRNVSPYQRLDGREQRSTQTRARIFEAALAQFRRVGFEAASVTDVARAAGVSRPSFYFHFPTKDHVLLELQWHLDQEMCESIAAVEGSANALHAFIDRLMAAEEDLGSFELFRDILQMWARPPTHLELEEQHLATVAEVARRFLEHARGGHPLPVPPERAALLFLSSVFGYLLGRDDSREERARDLHALVGLYLGELEGDRA